MRQAAKIVRRLNPDATAQGTHPKLRHRATTSLGDALIAGGAVRAVRTTSEEKSLRDVFTEVAVATGQLNALADQISEAIRTIEFHMRRMLDVHRILKTTLDDGVTLGWSARRGYWRFVIVDDEDGAIDLLDTALAERVHAFVSGGIERIVAQAQDLVRDRRR